MSADSRFDITIVGYGPAAVTAAIYSARKKLNVLLIGELPGGEVRNSGEIENWPGDGVTDGNTLASKFASHLKLHADNVTIKTDKVTRIEHEAGVFTCHTESSGSYTSSAVIYAAGRHPRHLGIPGETEFRNRGVTYCATCDAPLFAGREVAVVGGGNTGLEAVIMLQKIASKIYLLHLSDHLTADPILVENVTSDPKVSVIFNAQTTAIEGDMIVNRLKYTDTKANEERSIDVQGIFVTIGAVANTDPVKDLIQLNSYGAIPADRYGATEFPGFFAAGDVTDIRDAQIIVAAGHGCSAALSACDYLARNKFTA